MAKKKRLESAEHDEHEIESVLEPMLAKKDWLIVQNDVRIAIKLGQDLNELEIPERFFAALKTEGVL